MSSEDAGRCVKAKATAGTLRAKRKLPANEHERSYVLLGTNKTFQVIYCWPDQAHHSALSLRLFGSKCLSQPRTLKLGLADGGIGRG